MRGGTWAAPARPSAPWPSITKTKRAGPGRAGCLTRKAGPGRVFALLRAAPRSSANTYARTHAHLPTTRPKTPTPQSPPTVTSLPPCHLSSALGDVPGAPRPPRRRRAARGSAPPRCACAAYPSRPRPVARPRTAQPRSGIAAGRYASGHVPVYWPPRARALPGCCTARHGKPRSESASGGIRTGHRHRQTRA